MVKNPPLGMPQCCPVLFYDDLPGAIAFLQEAFGLRERFVARSKQGEIEHAQLSYRDAVVMLSPARSPHALRPTATPKRAGALHGCVYLFVDDVDATVARGRDAGAELAMVPTDMPYGDRVACMVDREGHFWAFATHTRDVTPE
jgi:uncharacterized glyoxalase superfamily protein PhnB